LVPAKEVLVPAKDKAEKSRPLEEQPSRFLNREAELAAL
jgi:hypothetical protein